MARSSVDRRAGVQQQVRRLVHHVVRFGVALAFLAGLAMVVQPGGPAPLVGPVRRLEKTAEGRSRIRIPSELSTARILVSDDAGRQSNFVPIQVGADGR